MNLYTIVTNDKYEFPVKSGMKADEVAEYLGIARMTVYNMTFKPRKKSKYKVIVESRTNADRKAYQKRYDMTHDRTEYMRQYYLSRKRKSEVT